METADLLKQNLPFLGAELIDEMVSNSKILTLEKGTEIVREGQFIKVIPIVLSGLLKVFSLNDDKELLLYYIKPNESCVMSFSAFINNNPSSIYAIAEENSTVLALPISFVSTISKKHPNFNYLFFQQYTIRYNDLLKTINHLLFDTLDVRLLHYLIDKSLLTEGASIKLSHKQIANDLGTAREVVSRLLKKLESENKIKQTNNQIFVLS